MQHFDSLRNRNVKILPTKCKKFRKRVDYAYISAVQKILHTSKYITFLLSNVG
jgi:hypothetical protein